MARQKRFSTEKEILDKIDSEKIRAQNMMVEAERLDIEADANRDRMVELEQKDPPTASFHRNEMIHKRGMARKTRKSATRLFDVKLKKPGETLAAFRTETLIAGDDKSVVMVK